jgi:ParB-like nuclease domain
MERIVRYVRVDMVKPNLRLCCSVGEIENLCNLLCAQAEYDPITVFFDGECFRIIDGEKRWRACKKLGMASVQAVIVESHFSIRAV